MKPKKAISSKRTSRAVTKSQKKNSESPEATQATDAWIVRPDALDLLVKTAVSMPSVFASFDEDFKEPQNDLGYQSEVKPLDVHVNWAAHLIDRCEALLKTMRHERITIAKKLKRTTTALELDVQADNLFEVELRKFVGEPQAAESRYTYAQVRLFLTGHKAPDRGDSELHRIWTDSAGAAWLPNEIDQLPLNKKRKNTDDYVKRQGLAHWQLRKLVRFATRLGKKKMPSAIINGTKTEGE